MAEHVKLGSEFFRERNLVNYQDRDVMLVVVEDIKSMPSGGALRLDMIFVLLCTEGSMQLNINGKHYEVRQGDMAICPPNVCIDSLVVSPDFQSKILGLSYTELRRSLQITKEVWGLMMYVVRNPVFHLSPIDIRLIEAYYSLAKLKIDNRQNDFHKEIVFALSQTAFYELFGIISRANKLMSQNGEDISRADLLFRRFLELLTASGGRERAVGDFAQKMCITAKYLSTISREASGKSAIHWIHEYTVDAIVQKLKYSDKSIKEIANELNFGNMSFFGKFVKAHLGMPPKEYRRQLGKQE